MVLAGVEGLDGLAVAEREDGGLFADEAVLQEDACAGGPEGTVEAVFDRLFGGVEVIGDDHALSGGQSIGFHHDGGTVLLEILQCGRSIGEDRGIGGRQTVTVHEVLGEGLGALELSGFLIRADDAQTALAEGVHDAFAEQCFGTDHGEADVVVLRELRQSLRGVFRHGNSAGDSGIAGSPIEFVRQGALHHLPRQGVLAATAANQKDIHRRLGVRG